MPADCRISILADRGFGDHKLVTFLAELGFGYVIRFRGNIQVADADGATKCAAEWVGKGGRARKLTDAGATVKGQQVGAVVCVHAKGMKEPWCLATSEPDATAATVINHYAKRGTIEPQFCDTRNLRFGMGLSPTRVGFVQIQPCCPKSTGHYRPLFYPLSAPRAFGASRGVYDRFIWLRNAR